MIKFTIDNTPVEAKKGETILNVARRYGIYIPTMCYITKTSPIASCRICSVEVEGVDGFVLSCNTPPTEGIVVTTNSAKLEAERTNLVKLYDVNHPLECGVCDKSGECDLQNKTLEFGIDRQSFSAKDQLRTVKDWKLINYDPSLCILCEKCVHVCNEVIGDDAIEVLFGGYKSSIVPKNSETLDCTFCGECIAVCPVGALVSSGFKYRANAWELKKIPATCVHCSAGCPLEYEVKHASINGEQTIYRVKNNYEYSSLCGAGRFGFDFDNKLPKQQDVVDTQTFNETVAARKQSAAFDKAVSELSKTKAISFSSMVTNEEILILNALKEKLGIKLFNEQARVFREFLDAFSSVTGKRYYEATLKSLERSDAVVVIGTQIATDNPAVRYALTVAAKQNGAKISYFHPIEDPLMQNVVTQFVKYEAGAEEGVVALLAKELLDGEELLKKVQHYFDELDEGYVEAESNVAAEEFGNMSKIFTRAKTKTLVAGADLFSHPRAKQIAVLLGVIERFSEYKVLLVPQDINTLGAALLAKLDTKEEVEHTVGYNTQGDFSISSLDNNADLLVAALNQQEGSFTTLDKRVLPTNVAVCFDGANLNEIAQAFGVGREYTVDFTKELGENKGYSNTEFDHLENFLTHLGEDNRGYNLENYDIHREFKLDEIAELPEFNGSVIYQSNPVLQFNGYTAKAQELPKDATLRGSKQFAVAAKIKDGDRVLVTFGNSTIERNFVIDEGLKGTIAINPTFDIQVESNRYRFEKSKIERVQS